jgi:hypothetical protein
MEVALGADSQELFLAVLGIEPGASHVLVNHSFSQVHT